MKQKAYAMFFATVLVLSVLAGCSTVAQTTTQPVVTSKGIITEATAVSTEVQARTLTFNNSAWNYDADNDVYWQIGVVYCTTPATTDYETLGIYIPGKYMTATKNDDGTYTTMINEEGTINGYTAKTAPMVFPVNTPGYSAQLAPTAYNYDEISSYLNAGFIYVYPGMRGRDNGYDANGKLIYSGGAPWGVTDLKAAVRFIRYNKDALPGNTDSIFVFGMSGGGAQTAVMGASGDSKLYYPYLEFIGAAMYFSNGTAISDAVSGAMAWCPITSLDYADEAYEWNMGQYVSTGTRADTTWTSALSKDLATAYAEYINKLGLKEKNGNPLVLETSANGIYTAGSYYDYLKSTIVESLNNFLADTKFPYTETSGGGMPQGSLPPGGALPPGGTPPGGTPGAGFPGGNTLSSGTTSTTYQTVQDYIASLNSDTNWVTYDAATNTATISGIADFVTHLKAPSKSVGAFDDLNRSQAENNVFGNDENESLHFDSVMAGLLAANQNTYATYSDWKTSFVNAFAADLKAVDKMGNSIQYRMNMYNPMYYLLSYYEGYQTSTVAEHWRIHTGIDQGDTASTVEVNLALALESYNGVKDIKFATVWNQGHTTAERTGDSTANFIAWVIDVANK
jgi:hypothetical protein